MNRNLLAWPLSLAFAATLAAIPGPAVFASTTATSAHHWVAKSKHAAAKHVASKPAPGAPADEYFGHQKFSILGVRNTIHDLNVRYDGTVQRSAMVMSVGAGVEDAMHAWASRYPGDLWLAHNAFQLDQIYMRVPTDEGHARSVAMSDWIIHEYPHTYYGKYLTHIRALAAKKAKAAPVADAKPAAGADQAPSDVAVMKPNPDTNAGNTNAAATGKTNNDAGNKSATPDKQAPVIDPGPAEK